MRRHQQQRAALSAAGAVRAGVPALCVHHTPAVPGTAPTVLQRWLRQAASGHIIQCVRLCCAERLLEDQLSAGHGKLDQ